jgi:hypothetical protein
MDLRVTRKRKTSLCELQEGKRKQRVYRKEEPFRVVQVISQNLENHTILGNGVRRLLRLAVERKGLPGIFFPPFFCFVLLIPPSSSSEQVVEVLKGLFLREHVWKDLHLSESLWKLFLANDSQELLRWGKEVLELAVKAASFHIRERKKAPCLFSALNDLLDHLLNETLREGEPINQVCF